ncbi:MAG: GEVED domain-containing protein [Bacteroidota bacterium]
MRISTSAPVALLQKMGCNQPKPAQFKRWIFALLIFISAGAQAQTYCEALYFTNYSGYIEYVQLGTINNVTGRNAANFTSYATAPAPYQTTDLAQGSAQRLIVSAAAGGGRNEYILMNVWIDYNADGDFDDVNEYISYNYLPSNGLRYFAMTFTVPVDAVPGPTRMRIRSSVNHYDGEGPCGYINTGEAEDYRVTIVAPTSCTGTPAAGSAVTSNAGPVCSGTSFHLSVSPYPNPATIAYQWEVSTAGSSGPFTAIPGQTYTTATITGQIQNSWYRLRATCNTSGISTVSAAVNVTQQPDISACYCVPDIMQATGSFRYYINTVQLGTINNTSGLNASSYTSYVSQPTDNLTTNLIQGSQQTITVERGDIYSAAAWIDFNGDGDFTDPGERVLYKFFYQQDKETASFTVPANAVPGPTRLRVVGGGWSSVEDPCFQSGPGEAEDYLVTIVAPCSVQPVTTTVTASGPTTFCVGNTVTLTASGADSYLWSTGATTPSIIVGTSGSYSVTGTNSIGCSNTSQSIEVVAAGTPLSAGANGTLSLCEGTTLTTTQLFAALSGNPTAGGTWSPVLAGAGTYTYTVAATESCTGTATATVTVTTIDKTINAGCYSATIARTYNAATNRTTFTYTVCANGCPTALGYIAFITQTNTPLVSPMNGSTYKTAKYSYKVSVPVGVENGKAIYGIKYEVTGKGGGIKNKGECDVFTFTLAGNVAKEAVSVRFKAGSEVINATAECQSDATITSPVTFQRALNKQLSISNLAVKAYPNPYTNKIRFDLNSPEAGQGSLEVFNSLGQKVKTVYKGRIVNGMQSFELNVPEGLRSILIYRFTINDKQITGKLMGAGE